MASLFSTRNLAIYASVIATLNGLWHLYEKLVRDRPRIVVDMSDAIAFNEATKEKKPVIDVTIKNKGRRRTQITSVEFDKEGFLYVPLDIARKLPIWVGENESKLLLQYKGDRDELVLDKPYRVVVKDGAGRYYPISYRLLRYWRKITFLEYRRRKSKKRE